MNKQAGSIFREFLTSKKGFLFFSGLVLVLMLLMNSTTRPTYDEAIERAYGKAALEYYLTLGKDTSFTAPYSEGWTKSFPEMKYYGAGFEILPALYSKFISSTGEFRFRHILNTLFGFLAIWFAALIAVRIKGYRAGILVLGLLLLSPTFIGLSSLDNKVIPLSLGYTASVYFLIRILDGFPDRKLLHGVGAVISIALAVSIRVAGVIVVFYYGLFAVWILFRKREEENFLKKAWEFVLYIGIICLTGTLLGLIFYPNFFREGFGHIADSLGLVKNFKETFMLFEGRQIHNTTAPWYYLYKIFYLTVPLFILTGFLLFLAKLVVKRKVNTVSLILLFVIIFPVVTLTIQKASVYNGWRHVAFIYPGFGVVSGLGIYWLYGLLKNKYVRWAAVMVAAVMVSRVVAWMVSYPAYNYVYYNPIAGNYEKDIYGTYEMEFYSTATLKEYDFLWERVLKRHKEPVIIYSNNPVISEYAKDSKQIREGVTFRFMLFSNLSSANWDYAILSPRLLSTEVVKQFYPPPNTIHKELLKKVPIAVLCDRKNKYDYEGINLVQAGAFKEGLEMLEKSFEFNPHNYQIWPFMGKAYFFMGEYQKAINHFGSYLRLRPSNDAYYFMGASFFGLEDWERTIKYMDKSLEVDKEPLRRMQTYFICGVSYSRMGEYLKAIPYYEATLEMDPSYQPSIYALYQIYSLTGNAEKAGYYQNLLR